MTINGEKVLVILHKEDLLEAIEEKLQQFLPRNNAEEDISAVGEYISQQQAMKMLNRKTTWFYNSRKSGELPAIKSGNGWWYKLEDIEKFISNGRQSDAR
jgi:hypothetical protein